MSKLIKTEYIPNDVSAPGGTLQDSLNERGLSQAALADRTGRPKKTINEEVKYRSWLARKSEDERLESEGVKGIERQENSKFCSQTALSSRNSGWQIATHE